MVSDFAILAQKGAKFAPQEKIDFREGQDQQQHPAVHSGEVNRRRIKISRSILLSILRELGGGGPMAVAVGVSDHVTGGK